MGWAVCVSISLVSPNALARVLGKPGHIAAEPVGDVVDLALTEEKLVLDLRPLGEGGHAIIDATYRVLNPGPAVDVTLFLPAYEDSLVVVTLDAVALDAVSVDTVALDGELTPPADLPEWTPPETIPPLRVQDPTHARAVTATIVRGKHTLRVRQTVEASHDYMAEFYTTYKVAYVLLPLVSWNSFGCVDTIVELPTAWRAAAIPKMTRRGDRLRVDMCDLSAIPVLLSVATWPPAPPSSRPFWVIGLLVGLAVATLFGILAGRTMARRKRRAASCWWIVVAAAVVGGWLAGLFWTLSNRVWTRSLLQAHLPPVRADVGDMFLWYNCALLAGVVASVLACLWIARSGVLTAAQK